MIPKGLYDNVIFVTGKLSKTFHEAMQRKFQENGYKITAEQFTILAQLWYKDGLRQQEIAEAIDRDKTTVSRVLDTMEKQGLIRREAGKDRRERLVRLTYQGSTIRDQLVALSGALYMQTLDGINEDDLINTINTLTRLIQNLK